MKRIFNFLLPLLISCACATQAVSQVIPANSIVPSRGVVTDGTTITGDGTAQDPLVATGGGGGSGTVTTVSVVTANGLSGTVANPTTHPAITLNITGLDVSKLADGSISNAEFEDLNGVTSNIQTQLNSKASGTGNGNEVAFYYNSGALSPGSADLLWDDNAKSFSANDNTTSTKNLTIDLDNTAHNIYIGERTAATGGLAVYATNSTGSPGGAVGVEVDLFNKRYSFGNTTDNNYLIINDNTFASQLLTGDGTTFFAKLDTSATGISLNYNNLAGTQSIISANATRALDIITDGSVTSSSSVGLAGLQNKYTDGTNISKTIWDGTQLFTQFADNATYNGDLVFANNHVQLEFQDEMANTSAVNDMDNAENKMFFTDNSTFSGTISLALANTLMNYVWADGSGGVSIGLSGLTQGWGDDTTSGQTSFNTSGINTSFTDSVNLFTSSVIINTLSNSFSRDDSTTGADGSLNLIPNAGNVDVGLLATDAFGANTYNTSIGVTSTGINEEFTDHTFHAIHVFSSGENTNTWYSGSDNATSILNPSTAILRYQDGTNTSGLYLDSGETLMEFDDNLSGADSEIGANTSLTRMQRNQAGITTALNMNGTDTTYMLTDSLFYQNFIQILSSGLDLAYANLSTGIETHLVIDDESAVLQNIGSTKIGDISSGETYSDVNPLSTYIYNTTSDGSTFNSSSRLDNSGYKADNTDIAGYDAFVTANSLAAGLTYNSISSPGLGSSVTAFNGGAQMSAGDGGTFSVSSILDSTGIHFVSQDTSMTGTTTLDLNKGLPFGLSSYDAANEFDLSADDSQLHLFYTTSSGVQGILSDHTTSVFGTVVGGNHTTIKADDGAQNYTLNKLGTGVVTSASGVLGTATLPVYDPNEIVFGDGSTPFGVTSPQLLFDPATATHTIGNSISNSHYVGGAVVSLENAAGTVSLQLVTATPKFNFSGSNILNIGGKDIDYSAANATGFWKNNGSGVVSYVDFVTPVGTNYTPTLTNVTNVSSSTAADSQYTRVGNVVTVFGSLNVTTTLAVATEVDISLPIASNFAATTDANGVGQATSAIATNAYIDGDATNDRARLKFIGLSVGGVGTIFYSFSYKVI